ncbi:MAG: hypothetical protein FWG43_05690 [Clostridiales bacterium]|nr:hypothetical protein [Clostridiales bacterium]
MDEESGETYENFLLMRMDYITFECGVEVEVGEFILSDWPFILSDQQLILSNERFILSNERFILSNRQFILSWIGLVYCTHGFFRCNLGIRMIYSLTGKTTT